jgi:hypothetical protein
LWSFERNSPVLAVTLAKWLLFSKTLNIDIYVSTDDQNFKVKDVKTIIFKKTKWKDEWMHVVSELEKLHFKNIISTLDDFYITEKNIKKTNSSFITDFQENDWDYLSLVPHPNTKCLIPYKKKETGNYILINDSWRYKNSLQLSMWKLDSFKKILEKSDNIWDFEEEKSNNIAYCSKKRVIRYRHIIEKGELNYNSIIFSFKSFPYLKKHFKYNFKQAKKIPRIILSRSLVKIVGFRKSEKID